jgi:hypothetical protein
MTIRKRALPAIIRAKPSAAFSSGTVSIIGRTFSRTLKASVSSLSIGVKSKALAEVTKNLRDAMGAGNDDDTSGVFAIYEEVPAGHWANGGNILTLRELLKEMGGNVPDERKREMNALFYGQAALKEHFGIPAE